jgi:hypothetical protein
MSTKSLEDRLLCILAEVERQHKALETCCSDKSQYVRQVQEYIEVAGEYEVAYESIVALLEQGEFMLSGKAAVALLELGLELRYKTDREVDGCFDYRQE